MLFRSGVAKFKAPKAQRCEADSASDNEVTAHDSAPDYSPSSEPTQKPAKKKKKKSTLPPGLHRNSLGQIVNWTSENPLCKRVSPVHACEIINAGLRCTCVREGGGGNQPKNPPHNPEPRERETPRTNENKEGDGNRTPGTGNTGAIH